MQTQPYVKPWYTSLKLQAAVVALILIFANAIIFQEKIDPDAVTYAVGIVVSAYIGSKAYEDGEQAKARAKVDAPPVTTVSTPGASDVTVTQQPDSTGTPPPILGRMG
jgi:hypothetical protein